MKKKDSASRKKTKKRAVATVLLGLAVGVLLAAGVGYAFFRPQLRNLYHTVRDRFLFTPDPDYEHYQDTNDTVVIWLDPGHGGTDPGAVSPFLGEETEASINYRLSRLVKSRLEDLGYTVKLAWDENTPPSENGQYPYQDRIARANADPTADLYICLHCNSYTDPAVKGPRLYYSPEANAYNYYLAQAVANGIGQAHNGDKPRLFPQEKNEAFYVLKHAAMPAFLLETLFVSNEEDAQKLLDTAWLAKEADGIASGIQTFIFPES